MFKSLFKKDFFAHRTFSYYIPAPPARKSGYQEREFDAIMDYIQSLGFVLLDFKLQSHSGADHSGLWVITTLGAPTEEIFKKKIDINTTNLYEGGPNAGDNIPLDSSITHDI